MSGHKRDDRISKHTTRSVLSAGSRMARHTEPDRCRRIPLSSEAFRPVDACPDIHEPTHTHAPLACRRKVSRNHHRYAERPDNEIRSITYFLICRKKRHSKFSCSLRPLGEMHATSTMGVAETCCRNAGLQKGSADSHVYTSGRRCPEPSHVRPYHQP